MRITTLMPYQQVMQNLTASENAILQDQTEAATGNLLTAPSVDPGAFAEDLSVRQELSANTVYQQMAQTALSVAQGADGALGSIFEAAQSAYVAGTAANSPQNQDALSAIEGQLAETMQSVGQMANLQVGDIYVFGGASGIAPWNSGTPTVVQGAPAMSVEIAPGLSAPQNVDGSTTVGGVLSAIQNLLTTMQTTTQGTASWGPSMASALGQLSSAMDAVSAQRAQFGAGMQRIESALAFDQSQTTSLSATQAELQDAPIPNVVADLATAETTYQAVLQTSKEVLLPSLANFLS